MVKNKWKTAQKISMAWLSSEEGMMEGDIQKVGNQKQTRWAEPATCLACGKLKFDLQHYIVPWVLPEMTHPLK